MCYSSAWNLSVYGWGKTGLKLNSNELEGLLSSRLFVNVSLFSLWGGLTLKEQVHILGGSFGFMVITKVAGGYCGQRNFGPTWINASG